MCNVIRTLLNALNGMLKDAFSERCFIACLSVFHPSVEPSSSEYSGFLETSNGVMCWAPVILLRDFSAHMGND